MRVRTVLGAAFVAVLSLAGTGCGFGVHPDPPENSSPTRVLTTGELHDGLIRLSEVGAGFRNDDDDSDKSSGSLGCLSGLSKRSSATKPVHTSDAAYVADTDFGYPQVFETLRSYRTAQDATRMMTALKAALDACRAVDNAAHGFRIHLDISTDRDAVDAAVSEQVNVYANGHLTHGRYMVPIRAEYGLIRMRNQVAFLCFVDTADTVTVPARAVVRLGLDRLIAVLAREPLPEGRLDLKVTDPDDVLAPAGQPSASA